MLFSPGDALGRYVIVAPAGAGGMGEVYKARDTRLNRIVALKVMGGEGGLRSEAVKRFATEAEAIAALNHAHICAIYDTGRHEGQDYLVLEYLEGETLAERLSQGALSPKEVVRYATQIADALDFAHRRGIIHRDLKPANVFLCRTVGVKLLDFGLARIHASASGNESLENLATQPLDITTEGSVVGTLHYLAPERLDGRPADARSDIFSYGAVLYEMVTGRKAFPEQTQARLIAAILKEDPAPLGTRTDIPSAFGWIVQSCLAKDPDERWQSIGDVARVLENVEPGMVTTSEPLKAQRRPWTRLAAPAIAAALASVATWFAVAGPGGTDRHALPVIFPIHPPAGHGFALTQSTVRAAQLAMSPDGMSVAFVARAGGVQQLWVHELNQNAPRPLTGTSGASYPFWSPDSRYLAFFANGTLKKIEVIGRPPQPLCDAPNGRGGTWNDDQMIVFSPDNWTGLFQVSASGGTPRPLTTKPEEHQSHRWSQFLPGGRVLFFVRSANPELEGIYYTTVDRPHELHLLRKNTSSAVYSGGMLLYVLDGILVAQPLDERAGTLTGEAIPLGLNAAVSSGGNPAVSASARGRLVTWSDEGGRRQLTWYDQNGLAVGTAGPPDRYVDFRLSPDERRVAVSRIEQGTNTDIHVLDLERGDFVSVSSSPQTDGTPVWSPDGQRLVFRSNRRGLHELFERPANPAGTDRLLPAPGLGIYPTDWSRQDGSILFHHLAPSTKHDVWRWDPSSAKAAPVLQTAADEAQAQLGPGRKLAYTSDEGGALNVYVRTLNSSAFSKVSVAGGFDPRWSGDGRTLFFVSPDGFMMSAEIADGDPPQVLKSKPLFKTTITQPMAPFLSSYVVKKDGSRFLVNVPTDQPESAPITVALNWDGLIRSAR